MDHKELAKGIWQFDIPEDMAKNIIDIAEASEAVNWSKSTVGANTDPNQQIRTSSSIAFREYFPFWDDEIRKIFIPMVQEYTKEFGINITQDEGFGMLRYQLTNKYDLHADSDWHTYRVLSGLIYLNPSDYTGGETYFKHFDLNVKPEKPAVVLFPSDYVYLHAAKPVTDGVKYVLVTWMNDLPIGMNFQVMKEIARITGRE